MEAIISRHDAPDALRSLWEMKFHPIGYDPLDADRPPNIIEQLNQTFTYIASARAARLLLELHPELGPFTLNLGTAKGSDIEASDPARLAGEVFAAVNTANNRKLKKDLDKVLKTGADLMYVFFMCPGISYGRQEKLESSGVQVWSLGDQLEL